MKTHQAWILAATTIISCAAGQVWAQAPVLDAAEYNTFGYQPVIQAGHIGSSACSGHGCSDCAGGLDSAGVVAAGACCGSSSCGGGCLNSFSPMLGSHGGYDSMVFGQQHGPLGTGGCCAPIWYDFHVEYMNLWRDDAGDRIDLTSQGAGGPIVLSTDDLDMEDAHGFRASYALLIGPATSLEASYFGTHEWDSAASVTAAGDLWSVFSNFGTDFFGGVQGFPQTVDNATFHGINYSSELHSAELNLRRRWVSANCLLHGSYLGGLRFVRLSEEFRHNTVAASGGSMDYAVNVDNDLFGVQMGTDAFVCVSPRFKVGAEIEGGVYANDARQATVVDTVDGGVSSTPVNEAESDTEVAFVAEANAIAMFRVTPRLTIRGGYTVLFMDELALATENFSTQSPFGGTRVVSINNSGQAFYHGANLGFTWTW